MNKCARKRKISRKIDLITWFGLFVDEIIEIPESESVSLETFNVESDVTLMFKASTPLWCDDIFVTKFDCDDETSPVPPQTSQLQFLSQGFKKPFSINSPNRVPDSVLMFRRQR